MNNNDFENYNGGQEMENQVVNGDMPQSKSSLNVVSLVLGIIALLGSCCLSFITLPFSIAGLICGIKYKKRMQKGCPGIVVNIIAIVLALFMTVLGVLMTLVIAPVIDNAKDVSQDTISNMEELQSRLDGLKVPESSDGTVKNNQDTLQNYIDILESLENEIDNVSGVEKKDDKAELDNSTSLQNYMGALQNLDEDDKQEIKSALNSLNEEDKKELKNALNNLNEEDKEELKNALSNLDEEDKEDLKKFAEAFKNGDTDLSMKDIDAYIAIFKGLKSEN